jgi:hypothetical protein
MNEPQFYVYELIDPNTSKPFYVGKGNGPRISVYSQQYPKVNEFTKTKLEEIALSGKQLEIRYVSESLSEQEAIDLEAELISRYGRAIKDPGGLLTNIRSSDYPRVQKKNLGSAYTTIQVTKEINKHIKEYCKSHGLVASAITERLWLQVISGSTKLTAQKGQ